MSDPDASIVVSPGAVSLDEFARVLAGAAVVLDPSFWPRVEAASAIVAQAAGAQAPVYGINTGFGKLASKRIPPDQTTLLQRNLIVSHCCGVGPPTPEPIVRLMMALKIVSLGRGASGVRREIIEQLQAMLARGICPLVPQQGSVGASGDLAPLAHMTAVMIGEGQALVGGKSRAGPRCTGGGRSCADHARAEGRPRLDQRYAVFDGLCHFRGVARPWPALRDAGDRRLVGRRGDGLDGAVPPGDPATAGA